jgi:hypothetical protein
MAFNHPTCLREFHFRGLTGGGVLRQTMKSEMIPHFVGVSERIRFTSSEHSLAAFINALDAHRQRRRRRVPAR